MNYPLDSVLKSFVVRDLPLNRRQQLAKYMNNEQVLTSECGLARDFRGIAQQLSLDYTDIVKLERMIDPFGTLLSYQVANKLAIYELMRMIETVGRFDVLDDVVPGLVEDIHKHIINNDRKGRNSMMTHFHLLISFNRIFYCSLRIQFHCHGERLKNILFSLPISGRFF